MGPVEIINQVHLGRREFPFRVYHTAANTTSRRQVVRRRLRSSAASYSDDEETLDVLVFGSPPQEEPPLPDRTSYHPGGRPLIRYSLLNKYLPLRIGKVKRRPSGFREKGGPFQIRYFAESAAECYCDEQCLLYGDCCSDYTYVCPRPEHCIVSHWGGWGECLPRNGSCGEGEKARERTVLRHQMNGGRRCPELREAKACFRECSPASSSALVDEYGRVVPGREGQDRTTVALLLDYKYHDSRRPPSGYANGTADWWWEATVEKKRRLPKEAYKK